MPDNPITDAESVPLDKEDWDVVFQAYEQFPILALILAQHLSALQDVVQSDARRATAAIGRAVDSLYEHSEFRSVSLELFRATVHGRLTLEVENLINELGIRT